MNFLKRRKSSKKKTKKKKVTSPSIKLKDYLECIEAGVIPSAPPLQNLTYSIRSPDFELPSNYFKLQWDARSFCTCRGLWTIVDQIWTKKLAKWIGDRKCLEIMAGGGWLSKALSEHGIDIIATDNKSWDDAQHNKIIYVYSVEKIDAVKAVKKHKDRDILLVSWPPYESEVVCEACHIWGPDRPIVYIGEGYGGCCAPEEFWKHFVEDESMKHLKIPMAQWFGIHDYVSIGRWKDPKREITNPIGTLEV